MNVRRLFGPSDEHFGQGIRSCAGDVRSRRVESHVENTLVEFLPVGCDLLNARFAVQVPQSDTAIMTCEKIPTPLTFSTAQE